MIILRQKQFGRFSFNKKKQPEYKCPKFSDLPTNLQQSLRGIERVWKKSETQKLLKVLGKELLTDVIPFMPYLDSKLVEHVHREIIIPPMAFNKYPDSTLIYPLMWDTGYWLLCFDITAKKFLKVYYTDDENLFEAEKNYWNLKNYISDCLNEYDASFRRHISEEEFNNLIDKIKKAFWI
jgi:hypothetical protein